MRRGKLNVIIDGQWGSTGKGKLAAYLALKYRPAAAICNFAPNAGHTHYTRDGKKVVLQQLPSSLAYSGAQLLIGPSAILSLSILLREIKENKVEDRLYIDPKATILNDDDAEYERSNLERISSTTKGCGSALARKVLRVAKTAEDVKELSRFVRPVVPVLHDFLYDGAIVVAESAQGFDLSLNHGHAYPYVTSRDVTPSTILGECGCPPRLVGEIYGCLRVYPIRVGNVERDGKQVGWSGPHYEDQHELAWGEIAQAAGLSGLAETTTVTGKVRRVFTWSNEQYRRFLLYCAPTQLFVNHVNYLSGENCGVNKIRSLTLATLGHLVRLMLDTKKICDEIGLETPRISYIGTGPGHDDMVDSVGEWEGR